MLPRVISYLDRQQKLPNFLTYAHMLAAKCTTWRRPLLVRFTAKLAGRNNDRAATTNPTKAPELRAPALFERRFAPKANAGAQSHISSKRFALVRLYPAVCRMYRWSSQPCIKRVSAPLSARTCPQLYRSI